MVLDCVEMTDLTTGWYLERTSKRPVLRFPRSATEVERKRLSMERMLIMLSISPSHLYSKERRRRWDSLGGRGMVLTYLPY